MLIGLGDQVILRELEKQNVTKAGIILTTDKKNYETLDAEVIVPSSENERKLKKGDLVIVDKAIVKEAKFDNVVYLIVPEDCIIARVEKGK